MIGLTNSLTRFIEKINKDINGFFDTNLNDVSFGVIIVIVILLLFAIMKSIFMNKN